MSHCCDKSIFSVKLHIIMSQGQLWVYKKRHKMHFIQNMRDKSLYIHIDFLATQKRGCRNLKLMEHPVPLYFSPQEWLSLSVQQRSSEDLRDPDNFFYLTIFRVENINM